MQKRWRRFSPLPHVAEQELHDSHCVQKLLSIQEKDIINTQSVEFFVAHKHQ